MAPWTATSMPHAPPAAAPSVHRRRATGRARPRARRPARGDDGAARRRDRRARRTAALLGRSRTALVLIDLQEGYRPALHRWDRVAAASTVLVRGAAMLDVPLLVTEQYPRGLGHTAAEVASHFPPQLTITEKMSMSCCGAAAFLERLRETRRTQVLIAGIETHACVNQTVHDLIAAGYDVHVARDATSSRRPAD